MSTTLVHPFRCVCGYVGEQASSAPGTGTPRDSVPSPGSLTLCFKCGRAYQFDDELRQQPVDLDALEMDPDQRREVRRVQAAIVEWQGRRS